MPLKAVAVLMKSAVKTVSAHNTSSGSFAFVHWLSWLGVKTSWCLSPWGSLGCLISVLAQRWLYFWGLQRRRIDDFFHNQKEKIWELLMLKFTFPLVQGKCLEPGSGIWNLADYLSPRPVSLSSYWQWEEVTSHGAPFLTLPPPPPQRLSHPLLLLPPFPISAVWFGGKAWWWLFLITLFWCELPFHDFLWLWIHELPQTSPLEIFGGIWRCYPGVPNGLGRVSSVSSRQRPGLLLNRLQHRAPGRPHLQTLADSYVNSTEVENLGSRILVSWPFLPTYVEKKFFLFKVLSFSSFLKIMPSNSGDNVFFLLPCLCIKLQDL